MDTKLKNIKYSRGVKIVAIMIMWVSIIGIVGSGAFLIGNADMIGKDSYYDTRDFQHEMSRLVHDVVDLNTRLRDVGQLEKTKGTEGDRIEIEGEADEIANEETVTENTGVETEDQEVVISYNVLGLTGETKASNVATVEEYEDVKVEEGPILARIADINRNLSKAVNFNYYLEDLTTGEVNATSLPPAIKNHTYSLYINKDEIPYYMNYYGDMEEILTQSPIELFVSVNEPLKPGDRFYNDFTRYTRIKELAPYGMAALVITLILGIASFSYLILVSGRREKGGEVELASIDKIYNDVQIIFVCFATMISIILLDDMQIGSGDFDGSLNARLILMLTILGIGILIVMTCFFSMLRQYKKGVIFKNILIFKVLKNILKKVKSFIHMCFNEKIFKAWMVGWLLGYGVINGILFIMTLLLIDNIYEMGLVLGGFAIIAFNAVAVYFVFKALRSLAKIMEAAKAISEGNLDYELDKSQMSMEFSNFAEDIQSIQGGLKNAVNKAIQGERMKTELITNVSHDLKTPLTSIINYVDLLKQEDMNNEKAGGYLNILEEKSNRLKQLIEDLIEASKASSGNLAITPEQVDLYELIIQARGEYEEKIKEAQLDIRINHTEEKTLILADGKYMWRIVENIMSNVLKYSMANSRVYIHIEQNNGYGVLIMKNVSAYPLDINPEQLTERFTRGDESRTTEGSGLGLSIAQSLASIQGGNFNVEIDGDLFKVTIEIPSWVGE